MPYKNAQFTSLTKNLLFEYRLNNILEKNVHNKQLFSQFQAHSYLYVAIFAKFNDSLGTTIFDFSPKSLILSKGLYHSIAYVQFCARTVISAVNRCSQIAER